MGLPTTRAADVSARGQHLVLSPEERDSTSNLPLNLLLQPALNSAPGFICWSRGFMELGAAGSRAELVDSLKAYSAHGENPPLLLFPEEAATNGRVGLLRFR